MDEVLGPLSAGVLHGGVTAPNRQLLIDWVAADPEPRMLVSQIDAVGTSLVVIVINSAMALGLRAESLNIPWADALPFLALAIIGTVLGKRIADKVPATKLTTGFVVLLVALAAYTATSSIVQLV